MWNSKKITLVLPTHTEKRSIYRVVRDFERLKIVDEILVVNNNAEEGTSREVAKTSAVELYEPVQGYGAAIMRGLMHAKGDYIVVCEPDATFLPRDIYKFLSYAEDFELVVGSRTTQTLIWEGANMGIFLKWGNYFAGKFVEFIYNSTQLTDVGCTYRLIKKSALKKILPKLRFTDGRFGLEMIILAIKNNISLIQIPVNYKERIGKSTITGDFVKALILGMEMLWLSVKNRY